MEENKEESAYCDGGIFHINIHSCTECDRHGFQLKELVQIALHIGSIYMKYRFVVTENNEIVIIRLLSELIKTLLNLFDLHFIKSNKNC